MLAPLLLAVMAAQATPSDTIPLRDGPYFGFEIGAGHLEFRCAGCAENGGATATHGKLFAGTMVSRRVAIGLDLDFWKRQTNTDGAVTTLLAATFFPSPTGGGFLRAGIGPTSFHGEEFADGPTEHGNGMAAMLGLGYEGRIPGGPAITPMISTVYNDIGETTLSMTPERHGVKAWVVTFGVGLTWH